ncbi:hypothetical protein [Arthrobacter sp. KNU40]
MELELGQLRGELGEGLGVLNALGVNALVDAHHATSTATEIPEKEEGA